MGRNDKQCQKVGRQFQTRWSGKALEGDLSEDWKEGGREHVAICRGRAVAKPWRLKQAESWRSNK